MKKEFMQGRVTEKIIMLRSEEHKEEKFLKSELHFRAYKLYPLGWQLGRPLYTAVFSIKFLGAGEISNHLVFSTFRKINIVRFQRCVATSS